MASGTSHGLELFPIVEASLFAYRFPQLLSRGYVCKNRRQVLWPLCLSRPVRGGAAEDGGWALLLQQGFLKECCLEPLTSAHVSQRTRSWQM